MPYNPREGAKTFTIWFKMAFAVYYPRKGAKTEQ